MAAAANSWSVKTVGVLLALLAFSVPAAAQRSASMGVSVMVAGSAERPTIVRETPTFLRLATGAVEMRSRLAVKSVGQYTLRIRSDSAANSISVRDANGKLSTLVNGASAVIPQAEQGAGNRVSDFVVRFDSTTGRTNLTAELIAVAVDQ